MEFLVEFDVEVPPGAPRSEVEDRERAEAAAAKLVSEGHLLRLWKPRVTPGEGTAVGLYRADSRARLDRLLASLPLADWMRITVTPLEPHPNDPVVARPESALGTQLPEPALRWVYRLEATLDQPLDFGEVLGGKRRIVPLAGGTFTGPEISGELLAGASADWQIIAPDGTSFGDIRYTLRTGDGELLYVRSRGVRHGSAEVLVRLARGEDVDAGEYTFRASTRIETAAPGLDWLNRGVFIGVAARQADGVIYETYLVR
jgi:muconolactone delta-isomerase